ncbi:tail terminator [Klebsiella phage VLCpiS11a]|uniref:tail terminator n=1 Tax=Klebsiella phage VLCpiS11a TaxID=2874884 RepID=UPI0022DCDA94|nr:tail terminator [Klebsiella phage VLCpiS11a]UVX30702.1 tail terminator [Klebsiella phage VLCpiS11a]
MGYFEDLTKAFDVALMAFGTTNNIKIALENIDAPTSTDVPYLASYMLLANTEQADLFWTEQRAGVYQIDINYAQAKGSASINKMADLLNTAFKAGSAVSRNAICAEVQSVSLGPLIVQNGWAKRPLSINFIAFTARL